jgi:hypothetical protein
MLFQAHDGASIAISSACNAVALLKHTPMAYTNTVTSYTWAQERLNVPGVLGLGFWEHTFHR